MLRELLDKINEFASYNGLKEFCKNKGVLVRSIAPDLSFTTSSSAQGSAPNAVDSPKLQQK